MREVPDVQPGRGEVAIEVVATAVNRADTLQRQGSYPPPPGASDIIGLECSGRVAALGEGVDGTTPGRSATRSARCWPAAATPRGSSYRPVR